jgi:hypothetical protein
MARTSIGIVTLLGIFGCLVSMVPAQESSRRTAKYRTDSPAISGVRPNLSPPPAESEFPAASGARAITEAAPEPLTPPATIPLGQSSAGMLPATGQQNATELAPSAELEDGRLRSVLKRPRTVLPDEAVPAITSQQPAEVSFNNDLLRRVESGPTGNQTPSLAPISNNSRTIKPAISSVRAAQALASSNRNASLRVELNGPQGVTVGKPAAYSVTLNNDSDTAADEVQVRLNLPAWVVVQGAQPTNGETSAFSDGQGAARLVWNVPHVAAHAREQLKLQIVTGEVDGFDITAEWTAKPAAVRTSVVVKQPQIALALAGPADMTFGEEKTFTLTVSNPGTGDAERVLVAVASGTAPPQQFDAGMIPAGHKKEVPLALVASQTGSIDLQITAAAENGVEARTSHKITIRKAEVNVAIDGPPLKFAGSEAVYSVAVTNSGSATADNVNLSLNLPAGAKYLGGIDGAATSSGGLRWRLATLQPGARRQYDVRLQLVTAGTNRVELQSQAAASGVASCFVETEVEAVSDLKLVINEPSGPTPISESATYELTLLNRGSQAARQVKILVQFSEGVEPVSFEGCEARIVPGQVLCQPLTQLGPGEQATLRIKAQAHQPGAHHFRIEVTTADGDAHLVSEGTTRFFSEGGKGAATARRASSGIPTTVR